MGDVARDMRARARRAYTESVSCRIAVEKVGDIDILKAAGVPMIRPFPLISFARLTLLPGDPSTKTSRSGIASPFWTNAGAVLWKDAACGLTRGRRVARRWAANMVYGVFSILRMIWGR